MTTSSVEITDGPSIGPVELDIGVTSGAQDARVTGVFAACELATDVGRMKPELSVATEAAMMTPARMRLIEAFTFASLTVDMSLGAEYSTSFKSVPQAKWMDLVEVLRLFTPLSQRPVVT